MTIAGLEIDAIYTIMIVSILVVSISLVGLCRACILERRSRHASGRLHQT